MKTHRHFPALAVLFAGLTYSLSTSASAASTIDSTNAYSYGANIGWVNWRGDGTNGAVIGEYVCFGYLYSANVGWINLGAGSPANHIQYQNNSATDFGVNFTIDPSQPGYAILRGYAYGANIGWINFEGLGNPRVWLASGAMSGYAYSANCGWLNLNDLNGHFVQTDSIAMGVDTDGNSLADAWEYTYFGHIGVNPNGDADGTGQTNLFKYIAGLNPLDGSRFTLTIALVPNQAGQDNLIFNPVVAGRTYRVTAKTDLTTVGGWGAINASAPADNGSQRTITDLSASGPVKYYHVEISKP